MPVIRIPDPTYQRLQAIAIPFEDTPITVIERLLSEYEARQNLQQSAASEDYLIIDPETPSNLLTHTRVIRSVIDSNEIRRPTWKKIVNEAHILAFKQGLSLEDLIKRSSSNIVKGEKNDSGFYYLPEINISVQGVDSNLAWRNTLHLVKKLKISVEIYFEWRIKEGSTYPGEKGKLIWMPSKY